MLFLSILTGPVHAAGLATTALTLASYVPWGQVGSFIWSNMPDFSRTPTVTEAVNILLSDTTLMTNIGTQILQGDTDSAILNTFHQFLKVRKVKDADAMAQGLQMALPYIKSTVDGFKNMDWLNNLNPFAEKKEEPRELMFGGPNTPPSPGGIPSPTPAQPAMPPAPTPATPIMPPSPIPATPMMGATMTPDISTAPGLATAAPDFSAGAGQNLVAAGTIQQNPEGVITN